MTEERRGRSIGAAPAYPNDTALMTSDRVGMSKREHFAALFLAGLLSNSVLSGNGKSRGKDLIEAAVDAADEFIKELAKADREVS